MKLLEAHPIADLFPLMEGEEYEALKADIAAHGLREPICLHDGKILDGRNRYRACRELNKPPITRSWNGVDPVGFVVSLNLHRRHLTTSQRAMIADTLAGLLRGQRHCTVGADSAIALSAPTTQTEAAAQLKVSVDNVKRARKVRGKGIPALAKAVEAGAVSVSAAADVAELSKAEQAEVVASGPPAIKEAARQVRAGKSKVNGKLVDDPPDIAKARAKGKIHPDVIPDVTVPTREPGEDDEEPGEQEEKSAEPDDEAWLNSLPTRALLPEGCLPIFDADALIYRRLEESRKTFHHHAARVINASRRKGFYAYLVQRFLKIDHPKHWLLCPATEHGGCGGTGQIPLIGQCVKCNGRGYWIK